MAVLLKCTRLIAIAIFLSVVFTSSLLAAPTAYLFRANDNSGNLVPGATIVIGSTTLIANTSAVVSVKNIITGTTVSVSVKYQDLGTGDYSLITDPVIVGSDLYIPITISKVGSTITNSNALVGIIATVDATNSSVAASQSIIAASNSITNSNAIAKIPSSLLSKTLGTTGYTFGQVILALATISAKLGSGVNSWNATDHTLQTTYIIPGSTATIVLNTIYPITQITSPDISLGQNSVVPIVPQP